jgi:predicted PurR-regulated permease PerM
MRQADPGVVRAIPKPVMNTERRVKAETEGGDTADDSLGYFSQLAVCGLFVIALFFVLKIMAGLLLPIIAAIIFGSVLSRIGDRLAGLGAPRLVVGLGLVAVTGLVLFVLVDALLGPLSDLVAQAPAMLNTLVNAIEPFLQPVNVIKESLHLSGPSPSIAAFNVDYTQWFSAFVGGLTPAIGEFFVFFATLAFFVVGRVSMRKRMIMAWQTRRFRLATIRVINAIEESLELYFGTIAMIYLGVGVLTGAIAYFCGLSSPFLWGALAFVLSFIPYFGAALITLALAAGGIVTHKSFGWGIGPAIGFIAVHLISENAIIPTFLGRRLEINPFIVFISIIFWTWMWGPVGAVMAVPLLLIGETIWSELRPHQPELPD